LRDIADLSQTHPLAKKFLFGEADGRWPHPKRELEAAKKGTQSET